VTGLGTGLGTWSIETSVTRPAAIAVATIRTRGDQASAVFQILGIRPVPVGGAAVRVLGFAAGEHAVVARPDTETTVLMPHAGPAVLKALARGLTALGLTPLGLIASTDTTCEPSAEPSVKSRMLDVLARAPSPLAIDLLLDQPRRWAEVGRTGLDAELDAESVITPQTPRLGPALGRLLEPPLVVAVGRPNIGKSTLANALAGRTVAVVADAPGTTRDHVGATLNLDGLAVQYADLPGLPAPGEAPGDALEADAIVRARAVLARADLVLLCGDAGHPPPDRDEIELPEHVPSLVLALRSDLGTPAWARDAMISLLSGVSGATGGSVEGVVSLARQIRRIMVSDEALADPRPWRFWDH
jgi:small GTP-binding protein